MSDLASSPSLRLGPIGELVLVLPFAQIAKVLGFYDESMSVLQAKFCVPLEYGGISQIHGGNKKLLHHQPRHLFH